MKLVLFDFDGTITTKDTYTKFILTHTGKGRLVIGGFFLSPLILLNKLDLFPSSVLRPLVTKLAFMGVGVDVLKQKSQAYVSSYLPTVMRPDMLQKIQQYKQKNDRIIVVSASISPYLQLWCDNQGLELICSEMVIKNGYFTGAYVNGDCSGQAKAAQVKKSAMLSAYTEIIAYGDTMEDYPMLHLADVSFYRESLLLKSNCAGSRFKCIFV